MHVALFMSSTLRRSLAVAQVQRFVSVAAFDSAIYTYTKKAGLVLTGVSSDNAAPRVVLNSMGVRLFPGIHTGVTSIMTMVGFIGANDGSVNRGYINGKDAAHFAIYSDTQRGFEDTDTPGSASSTGLNTNGPITTTNTVTAGAIVVTGTDDSYSPSTGVLTIAGGVGIAKHLYIGGAAIVDDTTDSSSSYTGAFTVAGGVGIAKHLYISGATVVNNTTDSSSYSTGALTVAGGVGIAKHLYVSGAVTVNDTTGASSYTTGSLTVGGGAGVAQNLYVGGGIYQNTYLLVPTGAIFPYASASAPTGYLLCDASAVSRTTYAALFAVIGVSFGAGNGTTTFLVPNLVGNYPIGAGGGYMFATTGGVSTVTLSVPNMPSHSHGVNDPGHTHTQYTYNDDYNGSNLDGQLPPAWSNDAFATTPNTHYWSNICAATTGITIQNTGSGTAFTTISPYLALSYIIKY